MKSKLKIGKSEYWISFCEIDEPATWGLCDYNDKKISIRHDLSAKNLLKTFIHELLHALSDEHHVKLTESQVLRLEQAIYLFLRKNYPRMTIKRWLKLI